MSYLRSGGTGTTLTFTTFPLDSARFSTLWLLHLLLGAWWEPYIQHVQIVAHTRSGSLNYWRWDSRWSSELLGCRLMVVCLLLLMVRRGRQVTTVTIRHCKT
jgi:hypothetical protein